MVGTEDETRRHTLYLIMKALDDANVPGGGTLLRIRGLIDENAHLHEQLRKETVKTDRERLLEKLDEDRGETLLLLADYCLDEGREAEAKGWGWLAMHHKWPAQRATDAWLWAADRTQDDSLGAGVLTPEGETVVKLAKQFRSHVLPESLLKAMDAWRYDGPRVWSAPRQALEAVVNAIAEGKWDGDLN